MTAAAPAASRNGPGVVAAIVFFAAAAVILTLAVAAWYGARASLTDARPLAFGAREFRVVRGNAVPVGDALEVRNTPAASLTVLQLPVTPFGARTYERVTVVADPLPAEIELAVLWANLGEPGRVYEQRVEASPDGRLDDQFLDQNPQWRGEISSIAIGVKGVNPKPWRIARVVVGEADTLAVARGMRDDWIAFSSWLGKSINVEFGGREVQRVYLPAMAFAAAALAAGVLLWRARASRRRPAAVALVMPFLVAWLALDVRWQAELMLRAHKTLAIFGGRPLDDRHLNMQDGELYRTLRAATEKLPATPQRVFVGSDVEYFLMRAAYHLYPHNAGVYGWHDGRDMRAGDYVFLFRKAAVRYDATNSALLWENGTRSAVDALYAVPGAGLFRIR